MKTNKERLKKIVWLFQMAVFFTLGFTASTYLHFSVNYWDRPIDIRSEPEISCVMPEPSPLFELRQAKRTGFDIRYDLYLIDELNEYKVGYANTDKHLFDGRHYTLIIEKPY